MLCYLVIERLFFFSSAQRAFLPALNSITYITVFMPGYFVLTVGKCLPQCVGRFKVNRDPMFVKDPPEFL